MFTPGSQHVLKGGWELPSLGTLSDKLQMVGEAAPTWVPDRALCGTVAQRANDSIAA